MLYFINPEGRFDTLANFAPGTISLRTTGLMHLPIFRTRFLFQQTLIASLIFVTILMKINTFSFVNHLLHTLAAAHTRSWLFGGWAEEVWGVIAPRPHNDIDLLYPAADFGTLDQFIGTNPSMAEILAKRFSHKRAVMYHDVMVEWFLLESHGTGYATHFFDGKHSFYWPDGSLTQVRGLDGQHVDVASRDALTAYRQQVEARVQAYQAYLTHQELV